MTKPTAQAITILFADVSGSTKLFELLGDFDARQIISKLLDTLVSVASPHNGKLIKTIGDEVMMTFPLPVDGLRAAADMQRRVATDPAFTKDNLAIRIGLHHGDALLEDNDVYGDAVNTAARMGALSKREQIVTTASTAESAEGFDLQTRSLGRARIAGKLLPIEIVDVVWQTDTSNVTTVQRAIKLDEHGNITGQRLNLRFHGRVMSVTPTSPPFNLGRDPNSGLSIDAEWVSRNHALIEFKRGYFMLTDRSTNGTWLKQGDEEEMRLHRDEVHLRKSGIISLGQSVAVNERDMIYFECTLS